MIEEAHQQAKTDSEWSEEDYARSRMNDKVEMLKQHLPEFLVKNKNMYAVLSMGIHELTEEQCKKHFEIVEIGIELILDEKLAEQAKKIKSAQATKNLHEVTSALKHDGSSKVNE